MCVPLTAGWAKILWHFIYLIPMAGGKSDSHHFPPAVWLKGMGHGSDASHMATRHWLWAGGRGFPGEITLPLPNEGLNTGI